MLAPTGDWLQLARGVLLIWENFRRNIATISAHFVYMKFVTRPKIFLTKMLFLIKGALDHFIGKIN